jgi:uncharacterized protein (TIGR04255 family)
LDREVNDLNILHPLDTPEMLPKYLAPPVVEVAISVQFDELIKLQPIHFGLFYSIVKASYPNTEYHLPISPVMEFFDQSGGLRMSVTSVQQLKLGRCWYLSENGSQLIQVQPDRLTFNWRKLESGNDYPSYSRLRDTFKEELTRFSEFAKSQGIGEITPLQCELTYVNHLPAGDGWTDLTDIPKIFTQLAGVQPGSELPAVEEMLHASTYVMREGELPIGRLHAQIRSTFRINDGSPMLEFQLVGRGAPIGSGLEGVLTLTDKAHAWIVNGFTALTTDQMHSEWRRTS